MVWLGTLKVDNLDDATADEITQFISTMDGRKAGKVELGWKKDEGRYYHFVLPEKNYDGLVNFLKEKGFLEIKKEAHPRVIKEGFMRIILTIEEEQ